MAPERTARAGGSILPGMRNSALASAALTSVALLAQTANAAPSGGDEAPSRDEVQQRVSSLYDQAEFDTGTFNATRASGTAPQGRAGRPAGDGRRPTGAARGAERRGVDPAVDNVTRQWFDGARSKLGPTVPAVLPSDRQPSRTAPARSARPAERADRGREAADGPLELTAGPTGRAPGGAVAELTSGQATAAAPVAELTAGSMAALPPATSASAAPTTALPASRPTAQPDQSSLRTTKERNQRKLARARELLTAYAAQQSGPLPVVGAAVTQDTGSGTTPRTAPGSGTAWQGAQPQQGWQNGPSADLGAATPATTDWSGTATQGIPAGTATYGQGIDTGSASFGQGIDTGGLAYGQGLVTGATAFGQGVDSSSTSFGRGIDTSATTHGQGIDTGSASFGQGTDPGTTAYGQGIDVGAMFRQALAGTSTGSQAAVDASTGSLPATGISTGSLPATGISTGSLPTIGTSTGNQAMGMGMGTTAPAQAAGMGTAPTQATGMVASPTPVATSAPARDTRAERAVAFAREQIGKPCVAGTTGPESFDGPGLTMAAWKSAGIALPRTAQEQARAGRGVALTHLEPGDLVLFHTAHAGIYTGNGLMIHAPGPGSFIREESIHYAGEAAIHSAIRPA